MIPSPCHSLDDFLAHDLLDDERARFTAHLRDCPECRAAVSDQQRLDALLVEAAVCRTPVPASLLERVRQRLRAAWRRRLAVAAAALAATVALVWLLSRPTSPPDHPAPQVVQAPPESPPAEPPQAVEPVRVRFPAGANVVAVPEPMESPNVTFIWVYPGQRAAPRSTKAPYHSSSERNEP
jgi:anti-sigma factor RsiW